MNRTMKKSLTAALSLLFLVLAFGAGAQQVKSTATAEILPRKTIVFKDSRTEDLNTYLTSNKIVRFWIYKAGSTADSELLVKTLRTADGVEEVEEEGASGDYTEYVLRLLAPRDKGWYKKQLLKAGIGNVQFNNGKVTEVARL